MYSMNDAGKQYRICCGSGDLEETLLVPGDPEKETQSELAIKRREY
ncbi:MAG: hypothetical protein NWE98_07815 [Candidatus Bathyarchaeota archaeon]|nr:hypothetical protein [Candidatus Bathyarchaeota archaeon]